ncbi:hypothetical protein Desmer_3382 [Desulfosporosinus meridiei DSM 13257]|uniref:Uncharacterized protein n=1 Tax=Desulfosporosinus meridiei (strain ATCC BAA-275 / DSM 13257 / KCTC 12902 / NCIMB 13706 / S10) TaxID=768704 RepID=J7IU47_DESMD|nr:hypothetical protein Desmer_3382 [Desulfosporosinus meridiei DSM 13257]
MKLLHIADLHIDKRVNEFCEPQCLWSAGAKWCRQDHSDYSAEHAYGQSLFVVPRRVQEPARNDKFRRLC